MLGLLVAKYFIIKVLSKLENDSIFNTSDKCVCQEITSLNSFIYKPCGHILTGDLSIIENNKLREIMSMGTKFREIPPFKFRPSPI
jgi:hypothetical protein